MRKLIAYLLLIPFIGYAQKGGIKGTISDAVTGETLVGATVSVADGKGVATDLDGNFKLELDPGDYTVKISYVGYSTVEKKVSVKESFVTINLPMETTVLNEVLVVSDIAISRKTPVAFSNIPIQKIQEQLGTQDIPMLLNTTPGVYATQVGGGDGDARVSIRGFSQQNVLVLVDGVPMNDMVNGRVYWSNWFGLDNLTKGVQVQRGLGASKLAIPAIGGTINVLTKGIEEKRQISIKEELGDNFNFRSTLSMNSGTMKGDWSVSSAISYRRNDGWVDQLYSRMFFYYMKIEKRFGKHNLSISGFGAPQTSGQRDFRIETPITTYSVEKAHELGIDTTGKTKTSYGRRYNASWGWLRKTRNAVPGAQNEPYNTNLNQFHKPVISLKHFWTANEKFYLSNIVYASYGMGGGTQPNVTITSAPGTNGEQNIQGVYDGNAYNTVITQPIPGERISANYIRKNYNEHDWYGALSTFTYTPTINWEFSGGLDVRTYRGRVYSKIDDLLGGDYIQSSINPNQAPKSVLRQGDIVQQNIHRDVNWLGSFAMAEYKAGWWSAFINVSGSGSAYRQTNYFLKKELDLGDTTLTIGYADTLSYKGVTYNRNSPGLEDARTDWKNLSGYTAKGGMNINLNEFQNVFFNVGYLNRAPLINRVFRNDNREFKKIDNEIIQSAEAGYNYKSPMFTSNLNAYYTIWNNRPTSASFTINGEPVSTNAEGMTARHQGLELDMAFKPFSFLTFEGIASIADWRWIKSATATILDDNGAVIDEVSFDPSGLKVGDAAQRSYSASIRIEPIKRAYLKAQYNYFTHNYANFNPEDYVITDTDKGWGPNVGRAAWRMPDYGFADVLAGYSFYWKDMKIDLRGMVMNVFDDFAITDAQNNAIGSGFNAASASVNVGLGRRWVCSVTITL